MTSSRRTTDEIQKSLQEGLEKRRQVISPEDVHNDKEIVNIEGDNINFQEKKRKLEELLRLHSMTNSPQDSEPGNRGMLAEECKQEPEISQDSSPSVPISSSDLEPENSEVPSLRQIRLPVLKSVVSSPVSGNPLKLIREFQSGETDEEKEKEYPQNNYVWFAKSLSLKDELTDDLREYLIPKKIDPVMTKMSNHLNKEYEKIKAIRDREGYGDALAKLLPKLNNFRNLWGALEKAKKTGDIGPFQEILENVENMNAMHLRRGCLASVTGKDCDNLKDILKKFYGKTHDAVNAENRQRLRH